MAVSLRTNFCAFDPIVRKKERVVGHSSSQGFFSSSPSKTSNFSELKSHFMGQKVVLPKGGGVYQWRCKTPSSFTVQAQLALCTSKALRWWDKNLKPNMTEINSAQELVDSLSNAGDTLVILDFYSPGCGGCKALHPKICQIAEANPDVQFLKVNYETHRSMCQSLRVHVLPFFRFYRGAEGRLSSFSCTVATIKKFRDALAKHGTERCSLGPAKGLEESELLSLAANREISFSLASPHPPLPVRSVSRETEEFALASK